LHIGISTTSLHNVSDVRVGARNMIERSRACAAAGVDALFFGDHHSVPLPYYQNTPILARCLAEWDNRPAGALYLLPFWHPVLLAEQIGTLASIAEGRFIMQCAIGPDDNQFPAFGISPRERVKRFEAILDIMRRLWAGETVDHPDFWQIEGARINPTPPDGVEVWIAAMAPGAIERAARLGDGWLAAPNLDLEQARDQLDQYRTACARLGSEPGTTAIRRDLYIGSSHEEALAVAEPVLDSGYRGMPRDVTMVGDAGEVAAQMKIYFDAGFSDIIFRNLAADQPHAIASIERIAAVKEILGLD
jgi:alkanesulfonate monooxygenase SsuD/methylene tetrahydromethanopterin reductase-like flavin-dependent oxidoreductase (luciferase family)